MTKNKETVVVGISGGVDSSVAAYLLKQQGYEVVGLFMQNWQSEPGEVCTSEIDFEDASQVCDLLDIKLHRANFSDDYWDRVFNDFLDEHKKDFQRFEHDIEIAIERRNILENRILIN